MHLEEAFDVTRNRDEVASRLADEALLPTLFPDTETRIVGRRGSRRTVRSQFRALGHEGVATFHFDYVDNGDVQFAKVCDGHIWRELAGSVELEPRGNQTQVRIELEGRTKRFVPEAAIRGPLEDQLRQMAAALRDWLA